MIGHDHEIIGILTYDESHQVGFVNVRPECRGHGVATMLWEAAKAADPELRHSDEMTRAGKAWVTSMGDWMAARAAILQPDSPEIPWPPLKAGRVIRTERGAA
jgi:hypothetical protein